jgi:hypothetical protein
MFPPLEALLKRKFNAVTNKVTGRDPNTVCSLCQIRSAGKRNVHVIPKFFTDIKGKQSDYGLKLKTKNGITTSVTTENTPHEDYLVCHTCEHFFSLIERIVANEFMHGYKKEEIIFAIPLPNQQMTAAFKSCDPAIFLLFVYSIMWRVQQSYHPSFSAVNMTSQDTEQLRDVLYKCMSSKPAEITTLFKQHFGKQVPFFYQIITVHGGFLPQDLVIFGIPSRESPYGVFAGEFFLGLANHTNKDIINDGTRPVKIDVLPIEVWRSWYQGNLDLLLKLNTKIKRNMQ